MNDKKSRVISIIFFVCIVLLAIVVSKCQNSSENSNNSSTISQDTTKTFNLIEEDSNASDTVISDETESLADNNTTEYVDYYFRNNRLLKDHFEKHGIEMGFESAADYEKAASDVINNSKVLHKTEEEDGDDVYYLEESNEFVVVSTDGYIRTYFNPSGGLDYFNRQ